MSPLFGNFAYSDFYKIIGNIYYIPINKQSHFLENCGKVFMQISKLSDASTPIYAYNYA
jgi:hypothetical protein